MASTSSTLPALIGPLLAFAALASVKAPAAPPWAAPGAADDPPAATLQDPHLDVARGAGLLPVRVQRDEDLEFSVYVDMAIISGNVGKVHLLSQVQPYQAGLPLPGSAPEEEQRWVGILSSTARGGAVTYELDHQLETRFLPQAWPHILHRDTQSGTENRRRELMIGQRGGKFGSRYRNDGHCGGCERREHFVESMIPFRSDYHCSKCKRAEHRIWRDWSEREVPPDTVDMLGAIALSRTMIAMGVERVSFPMIDKRQLWVVELSLGAEKTLSTPAGEFRCREVKLATKVPPGEEADDEDFKGLFGIRGQIHIWAHHTTGVPVLIEGQVPLGPFELDARIRLKSYRGTPAEFLTLEEEARARRMAGRGLGADEVREREAVAEIEDGER